MGILQSDGFRHGLIKALPLFLCDSFFWTVLRMLTLSSR